MAELWETIDDRLPDVTWWLQSSGLGEGRPSGFASSPPINLHNYAMLSYASHVDRVGPDDSGPLPVYQVLAHWDRVASAAGGDLRNLAWIKHQPWIGDLVADLRTIAVQVKAATGEPPPRPIGRCRRILGLGEGELVVCGEPLYMPEPARTEIVHSTEDAEPLTEVQQRLLDAIEADMPAPTVWDCPTVRCPRPTCGEEYTGAALLRLKLIADQDRRHSRSNLLSASEGPHQRMWPGGFDPDEDHEEDPPAMASGE
jgi:hypothetical protein